ASPLFNLHLPYLSWLLPPGCPIQALSKIRPDLPVYIFSGSDDPVGQQLQGVRILIERYQKAGLRNISSHFYDCGRHEMLNELNREQVRTDLLAWLASVLPDPS